MAYIPHNPPAKIVTSVRRHGYRSALSRHKTESNGRKETGFMCDTYGKVIKGKDDFDIHKTRHLEVKVRVTCVELGNSH